jgi:hypothetical protein
MFTRKMSLTELATMGVEPMDDEAIAGFLSSQGVGILGLPTEGLPYMIPMSFGYDGDGALYFTYVLGTESRKQELSDRVDRARFLVYTATSKFSWQSVTLSGQLSLVPESEWDEYDDVMANAWHPDVFARAELGGGIRVYRFDIEDRVGYKQTGLPPAFDPDE